MMLNTTPELRLPQKGEYGKVMGLDKLIFSLILKLRVANGMLCGQAVTWAICVPTSLLENNCVLIPSKQPHPRTYSQ